MPAPSLCSGGSHQDTPQSSVRGDGGGQGHHSRTSGPPLDTKIYHSHFSKTVKRISTEKPIQNVVLLVNLYRVSLLAKYYIRKFILFSQPQILCGLLFHIYSFHHP